MVQSGKREVEDTMKKVSIFIMLLALILTFNAYAQLGLVGVDIAVKGIWEDVRVYGADGSDDVDDTTEIKAAFTAATANSVVYFPPGTFRVNDTITCGGTVSIEFHPDASLLYTGSDNEPALLIGDNAANYALQHYEKLDVVRDTQKDWGASPDLTCVGIKFINIGKSLIDIERVQGFTIGILFEGDGTSVSGSCAYNKLWVNYLSNNMIGIADNNITTGYTNAYTVYGPNDITISSSLNSYNQETFGFKLVYSNQWMIINPSIELGTGRSSDAICFHFGDEGQQNDVVGMRNEGNDSVAEFVDDATNNRIQCTYGLVPFDESGANYPGSNVVFSTREQGKNLAGETFYISPAIYDRASYYDGSSGLYVDGLLGYTSGDALTYEYLISSHIIGDNYIYVPAGKGVGVKVDVSGVDSIIVAIEGDTTSTNLPYVSFRCYDSSDAVVTTAGTVTGLTSQGITYSANFGGSFYASRSARVFASFASTVDHIDVILEGHANCKLKGFQLSTPYWNQHDAYAYTDVRRDGPRAVQYPTRWYYDEGKIIWDANAEDEITTGFICTNRADTTVKTTITTPYSTTIDITDTSDMLAGDIIGYTRDDGLVAFSSIVTVDDADTVTIADTPTADATAGNAVYSNRWAYHGVISQSDTSLHLKKTQTSSLGLILENPQSATNGGVGVYLRRDDENRRGGFIAFGDDAPAYDWYFGQLYDGGSANTVLSVSPNNVLLDSTQYWSGNFVGFGVGNYQPTHTIDVLPGAADTLGIKVGRNVSTGEYTGIGLSTGPAAITVKSGLVFERTASTYGIGKIHLLNDVNDDSSEAALADAAITIDGSDNNKTTFSGAGAFGGNLTIQKTDPSIIFDESTASDTDFWSGVVADQEGDNDDYLAIGTGTTPGSNAKVAVDESGNVGIGTTEPETLQELAGTAPYLTLQNTTEEDGEGGRESKITAKGEQSGGEEKTLGSIEFSHDGTSDDQKGQFVIYLNDGADDDTPTEVLRIDDSGLVLSDKARVTRYIVIHPSQLSEEDTSPGTGTLEKQYDETAHHSIAKYTSDGTDKTLKMCYTGVIPASFAEFPANAFTIYTKTSDNANTTINASMYNAGLTVDSTIDGLDVEQGDTSLGSTSSNIGGTYAAGELFSIEVSGQGDASDEIDIGLIIISYLASN